MFKVSFTRYTKKKKNEALQEVSEGGEEDEKGVERK